MKKILVTGGAGYIGSHTVVALHEAGYTPIIVDNFSNAEKNVLDALTHITKTNFICHEGNVSDTEFLASVFEKELSFEGIIHFAAHKAVGESIQKPLKYYRNNIDSLLTLLEVAQKNSVTNIVFSSSATVYGDQTENPITELAKRKPATNPYGNTKVIAEDVLRDTTESGARISAIALRYFNPIGAHPSGLIGELPIGTPANLVPYMTQAAAKLREPLTVFGNDYDTPDGTGIRDYIHVVDLANAHVKALQYLSKQDPPFYDVFNVGTGAGTSVTELLELFEKTSGIKVPHTIGARRHGDIAACWADNTKITSLLQWAPQYSITDALTHAWQWQQNIQK